MVNKIEISGALRQRIENFLANLKAELETTASRRELVTDELARLEVERLNLLGQFQSQRATAWESAAAAQVLQTTETRQRLVVERANGLRNELESMSQVSLIGAESILSDVTIVYCEALKEGIADVLAPFCPNRGKAIQIAKMTDAFTQLRGVNALASRVGALAATPASVEHVTGILQRVLRGQPTLGADSTES
jgi:hypothetical protein